MILELFSSAIATIAFSLLFGVPKAYYLPCGTIGAAGWMMYRLMLALHISNTFAVFFATMVIVLLSRFTAVRKRCPSTIFLIAGIFPLVPGARFYWAAYYLVTNQIPDFLTSGMDALKTMIAIVLGIIFVFEIPHKFFYCKRK